MKKVLPTLEDYYEVIQSLPLKSKYTKEELMIPELLVKAEKTIEIYYAAHNEHFNPNAKIFIVGITPGFAQMERSIVVARRCIEEKLSLEEMAYLCKKEARFSGQLRKNICVMLDELGLNQVLSLKSTSDLFEETDALLHTTSMIPFATFVKGKNYTGHTPNLMKSRFLMEEVEAHFYPQVEVLKKALIIPLGKCVEEVVKGLIEAGKLDEKCCLLGFPHPSGANVHAKKQFEEEKQQMMVKVREFWG